jgi:SAM-dependent methyltransferase
MTMWGVGDYPLMAEQPLPAAQLAVDAAAVTSGDRVLDVATGTGNAALLASERGGQVAGVDFEPILLAIAEDGARAMGHDVRWLHGTVEGLPVPDESADVVLSVFGVMYAADHAAAARELARVAAPHGRVVLASWLPGSAMSAMGQVLSGYLPAPPPSSGPPSRWGDVTALRALLADFGLRLTNHSSECITLTFADVEAGADFLIATGGHIISERQRLIQLGRWETLRGDLASLVQERAAPCGAHVELRLE